MEPPNLCFAKDGSNVKPEVFAVRGKSPRFHTARDLLQPPGGVGVELDIAVLYWRHGLLRLLDHLGPQQFSLLAGSCCQSPSSWHVSAVYDPARPPILSFT